MLSVVSDSSKIVEVRCSCLDSYISVGTVSTFRKWCSSVVLIVMPCLLTSVCVNFSVCVVVFSCLVEVSVP